MTWNRCGVVALGGIVPALRGVTMGFALCWLAACDHDVATGRRCGSDQGCGAVNPRSAGGVAGAGSAGVSNSGAPGSGGAGHGTVRSNNDNLLSVHVEDIQKMTIRIVTLACAGDCAEIEAVAVGGNPPYAFEWEDGSQIARRRVCLDASQKLGVSTTDTATASGEFHYDAQTAHADLTATVLDCVPDAGGIPSDATAYWTHWSSVTPGTPGTAGGTIALPDGDVAVSYNGEVGDGSATTGMVSTSFAGVIEFAPPQTYRSATIASGPPPSGLIAVSGNPAGLTQTIAFSVPVRDPLIAVVSMGSITQGMTWQLNATPAVLSNGADPIGFTGMLTTSGQSLTGTEGSGVVQLAGTFTSISFTTSPEIGLDWCGFTLGIRGRH